MKELVILVEEPSMRELLKILLPKIVPDNVTFQVIAFDGKSDLQSSGPRKLQGWQNSEASFIVARDQDAGDCVRLKQELIELCARFTENNFLVRIVCHELESWYFGDLEAVGKAYGRNLQKYVEKAKYRIPDEIVNPYAELKKIIPELTQIVGAQTIAPFMDIDRNRSKSFQVFVAGVRKLCR